MPYFVLKSVVRFKDTQYMIVSIRLNTRCSSCSVVVPLQSQ